MGGAVVMAAAASQTVGHSLVRKAANHVGNLAAIDSEEATTGGGVGVGCGTGVFPELVVIWGAVVDAGSWSCGKPQHFHPSGTGTSGKADWAY